MPCPCATLVERSPTNANQWDLHLDVPPKDGILNDANPCLLHQVKHRGPEKHLCRVSSGIEPRLWSTQCVQGHYILYTYTPCSQHVKRQWCSCSLPLAGRGTMTAEGFYGHKVEVHGRVARHPNRSMWRVDSGIKGRCNRQGNEWRIEWWRERCARGGSRCNLWRKELRSRRFNVG